MKAVNVIITDNELHNVQSKLLTVLDDTTEEDIVKLAYGSFHYDGYAGYKVYTKTKTIWDGVEWKGYDYTLEYAELQQPIVICSECQQTSKANMKKIFIILCSGIVILLLGHIFGIDLFTRSILAGIIWIGAVMISLVTWSHYPFDKK